LEQRLGPIARPNLAEPCAAAHTCLDYGEEEYTRGRPHPMIDTRLRAEALRQAMLDPACAVVLFDVILGYGANPDPVGPLLPAMATGAEGPVCVAHVVGTDADPQGLADQTARLREAGVLVAPTNAAAARLAGEMLPI
jgi:FdrA protein